MHIRFACKLLSTNRGPLFDSNTPPDDCLALLVYPSPMSVWSNEIACDVENCPAKTIRPPEKYSPSGFVHEDAVRIWASARGWIQLDGADHCPEHSK